MQTPRGNVLVVEDDDSVRRLLTEVLRKRAHANVEGARDGVDALHDISQNRYAVIILDLMMPKMSGTDVIDSVKAFMFDPSVNDLNAPPAIVIITAATDAEIPTDVLVNRCALVKAVFRKPLDIAALSDCVEQLLSH